MVKLSTSGVGSAGASALQGVAAPARPGAGRAAAPAESTLRAAPVGAPPRVEVYDGRAGKDVLLKAPDRSETGDETALTAFQNAKKVDDFLKSTFDRNGWDGKGAPLRVVVHAPDPDSGDKRMNNAYWDADRQKIYLGDGDGRIFQPLGGALDVLTHETTHALVDSEVNLRYSGQQGALNESWADVLGALADPDDWLIGEDAFTPGVKNDAIRDLAKPRFASVKAIPPGAETDVHDLSGVPSLAAVRVAEKLGREPMGQIWYQALTQHLDSRSGFAGAARATLDAAVDLHGADSKEFSAVMDAWKSVGVNPRYRTK